MKSRSILSYAVVVVGLTVILGAMSRCRTSANPIENEENKGTRQTQPFDQTQKLAELANQIAGREERPSGEVFKNIQLLKAMPAGRLLKVMELGYSKSLGVNCTHCHVVDQWEKDDKPTKQVAREMIKMAGAINNDYLKNIKNLKSENPVINCTTCHRGQTKPALNM